MAVGFIVLVLWTLQFLLSQYQDFMFSRREKNTQTSHFPQVQALDNYGDGVYDSIDPVFYFSRRPRSVDSQYLPLFPKPHDEQKYSWINSRSAMNMDLTTG